MTLASVPASRLPRVMRFGLVGLVATATDFGVFNLGIALAAAPTHAYVVAVNTGAFACATIVSYRLNSRFTFGAAHDRAVLARYVLVAVGGAAVYDGSLLAMLHVFPLDDRLLLNLAKVAAVALSAAWNFFGFATFAFRGRAVTEDVRVAS